MIGMSATDAAAALDRAGFTGSRAPFGNVAVGATVTGQVPAAGSLVGKVDPVRLTFSAPPPPPKDIGARDWALIARDPGAHVGEAIVVYGQVTQFDTATGTSGFRANVDGVKHPVKYGYADYETNTILVAASASTLGDLVNKDLFRAEIVVEGSYSYETTMGGTLTVPKLRVTKIEITGQAK